MPGKEAGGECGRREDRKALTSSPQEGKHALCAAGRRVRQGAAGRGQLGRVPQKAGHRPESKREPLNMCQRGDSLCFGEFILAAGWRSDGKGWREGRDRGERGQAEEERQGWGRPSQAQRINSSSFSFGGKLRSELCRQCGVGGGGSPGRPSPQLPWGYLLPSFLCHGRRPPRWRQAKPRPRW